MTEQQLEKGQEIRRDISTLQSSLADISRSKIFSIDSSSCTFTGKMADPFLAQLETDVKSMATSKIVSEIQKLEDEFANL